MKRGTRQHPKFKAFRALLGVDEAYCVGVLESLWMAVEEFQDDGAIGRWSDSRIAGAIGWSGDARQLVMFLVECEWLDRVDGPDRLVVHDWLSHCASNVWDRVKKRVARATASPAWLVAMRDKAVGDRNKNSPDPSGGSGGVRDGSMEPERPAASGSVRQRPAAGDQSDPYPRPKTQDLGHPAAPDAGDETRPAGSSASTGSAGPAVSSGEDPVVLWFPCDGVPKRWGLPRSLAGQLRERFPSLAIDAEFRAALAHVEAKPQNRKTASGMAAYLTNWLTRSQNNPRMRARPDEAIPVARAAPDRRAVREKELEEALKT